MADPSSRPGWQAFQMAWPATLEVLLIALSSMISLSAVKVLGTETIAAVGLANQANSFLGMTLAGLVTGTTAVVARATGAGQSNEARHGTLQSWLLVLAVTGSVTLLLYPMAPLVIRVLGGSDQVITPGVTYLRGLLLVFPLWGCSLVLAASWRGVGVSTLPAVITMVGYGAIALLSPIFVPRWGIAGAMWAFMIGQCISAVFMHVSWLLHGGAIQPVRQSSGFRPDPVRMRQILKLGLPAAIEQFVQVAGQLLFFRQVPLLGLQAYAAQSVVSSFMWSTFALAHGSGVAVLTLVGHAIGAGQLARARKTINGVTIVSAFLQTMLGIAIFLWGGPLVRLLTPNEEVFLLTMSILPVLAFYQPALAIFTALGNAMRGAGEGRLPLQLTFVGIWLIRLPAALLLIGPLGMGLHGIWWAMSLDFYCRATLLLPRYRKMYVLATAYDSVKGSDRTHAT